MNTENIARGWALIAEGAEMISMAYAAIEPPAHAGEAPVRSSAEVSPSSVGHPAPELPPSFEDLPPEESEAPARGERNYRGADPATAVSDVSLGYCPDHKTPWTIQPAGVSRTTGEPYDSFWKCAEKTDGKRCQRKPYRAWQDSHKIPAATAA